MPKCIVLILSIIFCFQAKAQFQTDMRDTFIREAYEAMRPESYRVDQRGKLVDIINQPVSAPAIESYSVRVKSGSILTFNGLIGEKITFEKGVQVTSECIDPKTKSRKAIKGEIESIYIIGTSKYVKVQGCDSVVKSIHVQALQTEPAAKTPNSNQAVAQRARQ